MSQPNASEEVNLDGNATPGKARELLPPADYLLEVAWVEKTMSLGSEGKKPSPRLSFRFKVAAGPHTGKLVFDDCYLTPNSLWRLKALAKLLGIPAGTKINPNDKAGLINLFQGKQFHGTVKAETYNNKERRRVSWYAPKDEAEPAKTAEDAVPAGDEELPF